MTTPFPNPPTPAELIAIVSSERFRTYQNAATSPDVAVSLYFWNAKVSGAFAEVLHHLEVAVRNAMHNRLDALHATITGRPAGVAWFDGPSWATHHWFSTPAQQSIRKAIAAAGHSPSTPRPGKVVSELNFGFWRFMASDRYEQSFWVPALDDAFAAPGTTTRDRRHAVEDRLGPLHQLRNRIAHCEPVFGTITYKRRRQPPVVKTLDDLHQDALELLDWIDPTTGAWIEAVTGPLGTLLASRPR